MRRWIDKLMLNICGWFLASSDFSIRRLLPLPASDWRDFSQDWFCGCCDNHKTTGKGTAEETGKSSSPAFGHANKHLAVASVDPTKTGDVFYTSSALFLLWQSFGIENLKDSDSFVATNDSFTVTCKNCSSELGLCDVKNKLFQFWHHGIRVSNVASLVHEEQSVIKASNTFCRLIAGAVEESLGQSVKIQFSSAAGPISSSQEQQRLFVWVIEPNLCLLMAESSKGDTTCQLVEHERVMKVIFQVSFLRPCEF